MHTYIYTYRVTRGGGRSLQAVRTGRVADDTDAESDIGMSRKQKTTTVNNYNNKQHDCNKDVP